MRIDKRITWLCIASLFIILIFSLTSCTGPRQRTAINDGSEEALGYAFEGKGCRENKCYP